MYVMLGDIALEPIDVTDFSETHAAEFAEHAVLKGKPRLQAMGEKLIELRFAVRLHHKIGGVESRYQSLLQAKAENRPLALIWGRGAYKGNFVITDVSSTTLFTDAQGNALCREMDISLKEFVGDVEGGILGAALSVGGKSLLGSILPQGLVNTLSKVKTAVEKGVKLYRAGKQLVDEVQNTMAIIRQLRHDPLAALAYLPSMLNNVDKALGNFGELTGLAKQFEGLREVLPAASEFSQEIYRTYDGLQEIGQFFGRATAESQWDDWFTPAENKLTELYDSFEVIAPKTAEMTAWIVLRADETLTKDNEKDDKNANHRNLT